MILGQTGCGESPDRRCASLPVSAPDICTGTVRREREGEVGEWVGRKPCSPTTSAVQQGVAVHGRATSPQRTLVPIEVHPVCLSNTGTEARVPPSPPVTVGRTNGGEE